MSLRRGRPPAAPTTECARLVAALDWTQPQAARYLGIGARTLWGYLRDDPPAPRVVLLALRVAVTLEVAAAGNAAAAQANAAYEQED